MTPFQVIFTPTSAAEMARMPKELQLHILGEFRGLPQGNYSIFEVQPEGYIDSRDTPGTTNGLAVNLGTLISPLVVQTFALHGVGFNNDAILQVPLAAGQHSQFVIDEWQ